MAQEARILKELIKTPKRAPRTEYKQLLDVPDEIRKLPKEEATQKADEFFAADKAQEFAEVRQRDIRADEQATYAEQAKQQQKIEEETLKAERLKQQERTPFPDRETYLREERIAQQAQNSEVRLEALQEKQRDLYLKARDLDLERQRTSYMQQQMATGESGMKVLHDQISTTPGAGKSTSTLEGRSVAIYNRINAGLTDLKDELRTKYFGIIQNTELADDIIRYMKDGKVKNKANAEIAKKLAQQWEEAAEQIKKLRNKAGARIGKLEDWILPQSHDRLKINRAGFAKWKEFIKDKLDVERIEKEQGASIDDILYSAYKNITTVRPETKPKGTGAKIAKRGEESRVLHFKDGEGMIAYKNTFGNPDIFSTMDSHIRQQSQEIASMQLFGSNPEAMYNKLKELAKANGMGDIKEKYLDTSWKVSTGQTDGDEIVDSLDMWVAMISGTHRALAVGGKLGSAMISSLVDLGNIFLGANYRGLSSINMFGRGLHTLLQEATTIGSAADNIKIANRIGVVSEFANASLANSRFADIGAGWAQKSAEVVIRASGLGSYTNSMRTAVGLEFAANMAENFGKKLDDTPFADLFKEYGLDAKDWDSIRKSETYKVKGAEFLDTTKVYDIDEQLGYRLSEMITNEMDSFVIMPTNRTKIYTTWGAKKGTLKGETARNVMLFKSFPIAITMMHLNRVGKMTRLQKAEYTAKLLGVNMVMGTITLWAYDLVTGKTPRTIDRPAIIPEALSKSGALGIFGDFFIGMSETQYGHSFSETLMGVPSTTMDDIVDTAQDVLFKDISAEKKFANAYNRAKTYIPGQNLWYTRLAVEKTLGDFMGELIDPDHEARKRRRQKAMRLRGQEELID